MLIVNAEKRVEKGKSFSRKLRIDNKIPGILYGLKKNSVLLILDHNAIFNLQKKVDFYKKNLFLIINNSKKYEVKVQNIQRHSFKLKLLHIDFLYIE